MSGPRYNHDPEEGRQAVKERLRELLLRLIGTEDDTWRRWRARLEQAMAAEGQSQQAAQPPMEMMSGSTRAARDIVQTILQQFLPAMLLPRYGVSDDALKAERFLVEPERLQTGSDRVVILPLGWSYTPVGGRPDEVELHDDAGRPVFDVIYGPDGGVRRVLGPLEYNGEDQ